MANETLVYRSAGIKSLKFNGYKIELSTNIKGPVASLSKFITVGKNRNTYKRIEGYYFATEVRREEWIKEKMDNIKANVSAKETKQAAKKEIRSNMINPFKVGEIYFDSWGYDQTNIDFYEIVEVKEKSVMIQAIGSRMVEGGKESGMSSNVAPDTTFKDGEPQLKPVLFYLDRENKPKFYISSRHGSISLYTYGDKGVYSSWYA